MKVIIAFRDKEDDRRLYEVGDTYPRKGYKPTKKRIEELSSNKNKLGKAVIKDDKKS